jgi:hypothetical protein
MAAASYGDPIRRFIKTDPVFSHGSESKYDGGIRVERNQSATYQSQRQAPNRDGVPIFEDASEDNAEESGPRTQVLNRLAPEHQERWGGRPTAPMKSPEARKPRREVEREPRPLRNRRGRPEDAHAQPLWREEGEDTARPSAGARPPRTHGGKQEEFADQPVSAMQSLRKDVRPKRGGRATSDVLYADLVEESDPTKSRQSARTEIQDSDESEFDFEGDTLPVLISSSDEDISQSDLSSQDSSDASSTSTSESESEDERTRKTRRACEKRWKSQGWMKEKTTNKKKSRSVRGKRREKKEKKAEKEEKAWRKDMRKLDAARMFKNAGSGSRIAREMRPRIKP